MSKIALGLRAHNKATFWLVTGGVAVVMVCMATVGFVWWRTGGGVSGNENDNTGQTERIISKVSKLYLVPSGETPTVAKIQDKSKLGEGQKFYERAENGDYLVVYRTAKLAMLYREQADKLVNVSPITLSDPGKGAPNLNAGSSAPAAPPRVPEQ